MKYLLTTLVLIAIMVPTAAAVKYARVAEENYRIGMEYLGHLNDVKTYANEILTKYRLVSAALKIAYAELDQMKRQPVYSDRQEQGI